MSKALLITGATGQQGGALIKALLAKPTDFTIVAVTRNSDSPSAKKLSESKNVKIVKGDMNDVPALFKAAKAVAPNIWGVFSVQAPQGIASKNEVEQGIAMIDEALKYNVKQFVYGSVDRGLDPYNTPTSVDHFATKYKIEHHLVDSTKGTDMRYTILRPVAYMDNFGNGFATKVFVASLRRYLPANKSMKWVDTRDIGFFGAQAFLKPEQYADRGISLAGDDLTLAQIDAVFKKETGKPVPETFNILGAGLYYGVREFGHMLDFFAKEDFGADIADLRKQNPGMRTLADWVRDNKSKL